MGYDEFEESVAGGKPVECYRFSSGANLWLYTSADREVVLPSGLYIPAIVSRGERAYSGEDGSGGLDVHLTRADPAIAEFIPYIPTTPLGLVIYRAHRGVENDARPLFSGSVRSVSFSGSEATLRCVPVTRHFERRVPALDYGATCNWAIFSTPCGKNPEDYRVQAAVAIVDGFDLGSLAFASKPDGWFTGGWIARANGEKRHIVNHVAARVTLLSPFVGMGVEVVDAFPGCDGTEETCIAKYENLPRHFGFSTIPARNPHRAKVA